MSGVERRRSASDQGSAARRQSCRSLEWGSQANLLFSQGCLIHYWLSETLHLSEVEKASFSVWSRFSFSSPKLPESGGGGGGSQANLLFSQCCLIHYWLSERLGVNKKGTILCLYVEVLVLKSVGATANSVLVQYPIYL
jgi:hypothetical protein